MDKAIKILVKNGYSEKEIEELLGVDLIYRDLK